MSMTMVACRFDAGDVVVLHGLIHSTQANGRRAVVHHALDPTEARGGQEDEDDGRRCTVRLLPPEKNDANGAGGDGNGGNAKNDSTNRAPGATLDARSARRCISVKSKNIAFDYPPGQRVRLQGLVTSAHLNGRVATVAGFRGRHRVAGGGGKTVGKFVVEVTVEEEDGRGDAASAAPRVKQMLVSPKHVTHLPGTKPPPLSPTDQSLTFTGSMGAIVNLLNHAVHKPRDVLANVMQSTSTMPGAGLLSDPNLASVDLGPTSAASQLWERIQQQSYRCRPAPNPAAGAPPYDGNALPPFYQRLLPADPLRGRVGHLCFRCHRPIAPGAPPGHRTKRCVKCRAVAYCGAACARADWDRHRRVCRRIRAEGVRFADHVLLAAPGREGSRAAQRMVRLCVNRMARCGREKEDGDHDENVEHDAPDATAKLLCSAMAKGGADVANHILIHLEQPPSPGREATVTVGFNSLGAEAVFARRDVQLFANIYDCEVAFRVHRQRHNGIGKQQEEGQDIVCEPNGEELPTSVNARGQVPPGVQEGLMEFLNQMMPLVPMGNGGNPGDNGQDDDDGGGGGGGGNNDHDNGGAAGAGGDHGAAAAAAGGVGGAGGQQMPPGLANFLNHVVHDVMVNAGNADGDINGNESDDESLPSLEDVGDHPLVGNNNLDDGVGAGAAAGAAAVAGVGDEEVGGGQEMPPGLANFLNHFMNEAGAGIDDANGGNHDGGEEDNESLPFLPDAGEGDNHAEEQPQVAAGAGAGAAGPFHFDLRGPGGVMGGAQVHVLHANGDGGMMPALPPGAAFRHIPGMPVGVQVAVAQAVDGDHVPLPGVGMPAGAAAVRLGEREGGGGDIGVAEEETEMEIES